MTALVGVEVKRTLSQVGGLRGVASVFFGHVATKPHEAQGQDGADLLEVGREVRDPSPEGNRQHVAWMTSLAEKNRKNGRRE